MERYKNWDLLSCPVLELFLRVYIEDTDAGGVVYYVNYLKFFERGRTELFRQLFHQDKAASVLGDGQFMVKDIAVSYHGPAVLDDEIIIKTQVVRWSKIGLLFQQSVFRGEQCLCSGEVSIVFVSRSTGNISKIPKNIIDSLSSL